MRLIKVMVLAVMASSIATSAWADHDRANSLAGALIGGALGGFLGSKVGKGSGKLAATAAGALLGAFVGGSLAHPADAARPAPAPISPYGDYGTPYGTSYGAAEDPYGPPPADASYPPLPAPATPYCREYTKTVYIGGRLADAYGTACLQPDGSWRIVDERLY